MNNDKHNLTILVPVYNDWESVHALISMLEEAFDPLGVLPFYLLVDDASQFPPDALSRLEKSILERTEILVLKCNLGHQRAIAVGLASIQGKISLDAVIIMDGDGEDQPIDAIRLWQEFQESQTPEVVFAQRTRRSEGLVFRSGYLAYRILHRALTGKKIQFGNFSLIPGETLRRLVAVNSLWRHYAASVVASKVPYKMIHSNRGKRIHGESTMNLSSLVEHGLAAISVYTERIAVRALFGATIASLFLFSLILTIICIKISTSLAIPGWATNALGLAIVVQLQIVSIALLFVFLALNLRLGSGFVLLRDYKHYILQSLPGKSLGIEE